MQSQAKTVAAYLAELPADRRAAIQQVRQVILANLDKDYVEEMTFGMISYNVPTSVYPPGYHTNPEAGLPFACLASQKGYMSLYMMGLYCGCLPGEGSQAEAVKNAAWFQQAWAKTGKKLDMGKSCLRFKKVEDLALDVLGEAIRRLPARKYIEFYEKAMQSRKPMSRAEISKKTAAKKKVAAKKKSAKKSPTKSSKKKVAGKAPKKARA